MATNIVQEPGYQLSVVCSHPTTPASGGPVRYGKLTGVAETDESAGGNASGYTTVNFGPFTVNVPVDDDAGSGIAVGDPIYYHDTQTGSPATSLNNVATSADAFFGIAMAIVSANGTSTIKVLHIPLGLISSLAANAVVAGSITDAILTGAKVATVADANVVGGIPVLHRIDVADASGDTDVVLTHKTRILDAWGLNTGIAAHASTDTWQVKNGSNAISDAVAKTATVNAIKRISTINPTYHEIAAGGTLRITAAKTTNAAVTVYVLGVRAA